MPGGMGGMMPGGGMQGMPGGMMGGMMPGGMMGGMMPGGMRGGMGFGGGLMPGGMMMGLGAGRAGADSESAPFYVMTVVETRDPVDATQLRRLRENKPILVNHKWGTSTIQPGLGLDVVVMKSGDKAYPSIRARFQARKQEAQKNGGTVDLLMGYDVNPQAGPAKFALEHGLLKEFREVMADVEKLDPNNPKVKALHAVESAMAQKITKPDSSSVWKQRLGLKESMVSDEGHYVMLYNGNTEADLKEVKTRLKELEESYKAFFYWFAFNADKNGNLAYVPAGKKDARLVPDELLVTVLSTNDEQFKRHHKIYNDVPLVADGFTAKRDNIAIFSRDRLDKEYKALNDFCLPQFAVFDKELLLKNKMSPKAKSSKTTQDFYVASTMALMVRSLEADSEVATITHEGPRQLMAAVGQLPRNVAAPDWITFGVGSFFETGKGAPWGGAGGPHWVYHQEYRDRAAKPGKMDKPLDALKYVVTDSYFRQAYRESDASKKEGLLLKARTMAWSLTYFLAHRKLKLDDGYGLVRYASELAKLPRDLEFDDQTLLTCFARAFNCLDAKGEKPDDAKLTELAKEWHRYIDLTPPEGEEVLKDIQHRQSEMRAGGDKPGADTKKEDEKKPGDENKPNNAGKQ
jgi:hypothetical protein